jgi:hypothetical protein
VTVANCHSGCLESCILTGHSFFEVLSLRAAYRNRMPLSVTAAVRPRGLCVSALPVELGFDRSS